MEECLRKFDGGGSGDDEIAEELRYQGEQAVFLRKLAMSKRSERTSEIDT